MQAAPLSPNDSRSGGPLPMPAVPAHSGMDREFIARNQIVERYLGGRLPLKGAQDFERYCREHPELLDEIGLGDRISAALRLLESGGRAAPWEEKPRPWWERLPVLLGAAGLAVLLAVVALVLAGKLSDRDHRIHSLQQQVAAHALDPALSTRSITVIPNREQPSTRSLLTIGGSRAEMADLKFDLGWSKATDYRVTIDRVDQGRVAVLHNVLKDSNGMLHIGLNSSALGPGKYLFSIDALSWRGEPTPAAWATITIAN